MNHDLHPGGLCAPQRSLLADGPLCRVEGCACGTVHVSFGPITLRLRPEAVESIWTTLGDAIGALRRRERRACDAVAAAKSKAMVS